MSELTEQLMTSEGRRWLAMQYVLNELSDDDQVAFEDALLDDVSLCELVVDATRLRTGIALAAGAQDIRPVATRPHIVSPASVVVAGITLAAVLLFAMRLPSDSAVSSVAQEESATADAFADFVASDETSLVLVDLSDDAESVESLSDLEAPEWLMTAVMLENGDIVEPSSDDSNVY